MKILGICLILGSFILIGMRTKMQIYKRNNTLKALITGIEIMQSELKFNYLKTRALIYKTGKQLDGITRKTLIEIAKNENESFKDAWEQSFNKYKKELGISKEDLENIKNIGNVIGKYDCNEQIKLLDYNKKLLEVNLEKSKSFLQNDANMIRTSLIMLGIVIVIVLI